MDSPANPHTHIQGLSQDSPQGFDPHRWSDPNKGPQIEMSHIASPPLTPSGVLARSNVKRPPLWPVDRTPTMPFPRQAPTPSQSSKASNLQHIPCKFFKSGACTAGKNCLFSHSRDPPSENFVCKYFLKGNCKFGAKCSLSHSFLGSDRKTSALLSSSSLGRSRLERRASSGAILNNNLWPSEPMSPPYGSSLPQQTIQLNNNNVEFTMGRSTSQQGLLKPALNSSSSENMRSALYMNSLPQEIVNNRSPFSEGNSSSPEIVISGSNQSNNSSNGGGINLNNERATTNSFDLLENRVRQHLAAPLPIRQRSLPDIFRLTPLSHDGGAMPSSPFYQPGNKGLFLSVSCESDTHPSSPSRLHSIPEFHDLCSSYGAGSGNGEALQRRSSFAGCGMQREDEDEYIDSDDDSSLDQGFLPSSLNDLLTTHERQRRQSRQEDVDLRSNTLPSPASGSLKDTKEEDEARIIFGNTGDSGLQPQCTFTEYDQHGVTNGDVSISPFAVFIPGRGSISSYNPQGPSSFEEEDRYDISDRRGSHFKERGSSPDPFCPFPQDASETHFAMDDDILGASDAGNNYNYRSFQSSRFAPFDDDPTSMLSGEPSRAVGSNSGMQKQRSQYQTHNGTMTPVSFIAQDDAGIDFSSLSISERTFIKNSTSSQQSLG
ncbi:hypothetical protein BGZ80_008327 [Entomortierella chlamydospora]|uniref:C3H1-type domain-containing protein n=1 Tax=Entomortierella chlamydospora TaxID=101097 RepID=A0A9P6MXC2_9FUNG|nr:hypothetical protein BGZ80_008327 [Entomortierella chlamydospora]